MLEIEAAITQDCVHSKMKSILFLVFVFIDVNVNVIKEVTRILLRTVLSIWIILKNGIPVIEFKIRQLRFV
jgi:hypothetical protein